MTDNRIQELEAALLAARADTEVAVALALEEAAKALDERGQQEQVNFGLDRCTQNFYRARNIVRAIAPASGVAKLEALRAERDEWKRLAVAGEITARHMNIVEAERAAANARETALRKSVEALCAVLDRNDKKGPIPDVEMMFCWLAAQGVRIAFRSDGLSYTQNGKTT